jgi:hypothetical protein
MKEDSDRESELEKWAKRLGFGFGLWSFCQNFNPIRRSDQKLHPFS